MARQSSDEPTTQADLDDDAESTGSASVSELWEKVRIDPVEIALPDGVGYTLRAYRLDDAITQTDLSDREEEVDAFAARHRGTSAYDHDEKAIRDDVDDEDTQVHDFESDFAEDDESDADEDTDLDDADVISDEDDEEDDTDEDDKEEEEDEKPEEVPVFLGHKGKVLLFRSAEGLVDFVKSDAPHDLAQLSTWPELVEKITVDDVVVTDEDTYELDLLVKNLRAGRDAWDADMIIRAGEISRDLAYALWLEPVMTALSPGSPLDDLDNALRASVDGGVSGFFAKRKLKKIGIEAAPLGWRTIIGKISAAVDWRD